MDKEKKAMNPNHVTRVTQVKLQQHTSIPQYTPVTKPPNWILCPTIGRLAIC
jgi:hypothetical protein